MNQYFQDFIRITRYGVTEEHRIVTQNDTEDLVDNVINQLSRLSLTPRVTEITNNDNYSSERSID